MNVESETWCWLLSQLRTCYRHAASWPSWGYIAMTPSISPVQATRDQFISSLKIRNTLLAMQAARALLQQDSRTREWAFIRKELAKVPRVELAIQQLKVALVSSFSTEFIHAP